MIILIGVIIVLGSVFGGFVWGGGHLVVLLHFNELLIIGGAAFGALVIMSPRKVLIDMAKPEAQPTAHAGTSVARPSSRSSRPQAAPSTHGTTIQTSRRVITS
jgi:hypothetical protein